MKNLSKLFMLPAGNYFYCPERDAIYLVLDLRQAGEIIVARLHDGKLIALDEDARGIWLHQEEATKVLKEQLDRCLNPSPMVASMKKMCRTLNEGAGA